MIGRWLRIHLPIPLLGAVGGMAIVSLASIVAGDDLPLGPIALGGVIVFVGGLLAEFLATVGRSGGAGQS